MRPSSGELSEGAKAQAAPSVGGPCTTPPPTKSDWIAPAKAHSLDINKEWE